MGERCVEHSKSWTRPEQEEGLERADEQNGSPRLADHSHEPWNTESTTDGLDGGAWRQYQGKDEELEHDSMRWFCVRATVHSGMKHVLRLGDSACLSRLSQILLEKGQHY